MSLVDKSVAELAQMHPTCPHCGAALVGVEKKTMPRSRIDLEYACGGHQELLESGPCDSPSWAVCSKAPGEKARRAASRAYVEAVAATAEALSCPDEELKCDMISTVRSKRRWYSSP